MLIRLRGCAGWSASLLFACAKSRVSHNEAHLKPATDDQSFKKFLLTSKLCPLRTARTLPRGYINVLNHKKKCIKSNVKDTFLNLQQMIKVTRHFCWHRNFVPRGLSVPALGPYTCIKSWKNCIKSDFKEIFWKLATNDRSDKMFLLTSKFCPQGVVSPSSGAIYMYKIMKKKKKKMYKISLQWDFFSNL